MVVGGGGYLGDMTWQSPAPEQNKIVISINEPCIVIGNPWKYIDNPRITMADSWILISMDDPVAGRVRRAVGRGGSQLNMRWYIFDICY